MSTLVNKSLCDEYLRLLDEAYISKWKVHFDRRLDMDVHDFVFVEDTECRCGVIRYHVVVGYHGADFTVLKWEELS